MSGGGTDAGAGAAERRREVALAGHGVSGSEPAAVRARAGLADPEPSVRATAVGALARLGELTAGDIESAAADPAHEVRRRAAELAAPFGPEVAAVITALLGDDQADVVEAACFGLGEIGAGAGETEIAALAEVSKRHGDPLCREAAVAAIGAIVAARSASAPDHPPSSTGRAAVLAAMADKPAVRRRAVLALTPFDGPDIDAALEAALDDRDWQVRQAAEDMTGRRRPT